MLPNGWEQVRRLLVVRLDNIGDIVMLTPALRALKQDLTEANLTLMASLAGSQVTELLPWVDDTLTARVLWQDVSGMLRFDPDREQELIGELARRRFDAAIIFTSFSQSPYPPAYACYLAGIPIRLGQSKEFGGGVLSQWVKPLPDDSHQVDRNLYLLESAGFHVTRRDMELDVPDSTQSAADRLLCEFDLDSDRPFIVIAPGASAQSRRYDAGRFGRVAELLWKQTQLPIVLIGSAREQDLAEAVSAYCRAPILSLVGKTSLPAMAAVIRRSSLVVANDSGPMHIADAFRRPMVVLFSGTELESQWAPRSAPAELLRVPTDCSPCYTFRCPYSMECLDIEPEQVARAAIRVLEEAGERRPIVEPSRTSLASGPTVRARGGQT